MRYANIEKYEVVNGECSGVSLYVQGCDFHCYNCFNPETWRFEGGKRWSNESAVSLAKLLNLPYIKRLSLLGGEPLHEKNVEDVYHLIKDVRSQFPTKRIWLYTGYTWDQIFPQSESDEHNVERENQLELRKNIVRNIDVLVDGRYIDSERDITLKWRGSKNQRVINVQESLKQKHIVLWCD